jgi:hypothetical protein
MRPRSPFLSTFSVLVLLIASAGPAIGARPPSDDDPSAGGALYGDLYVLERDGNGEPILFEFEYTDPHTGLEEEVACHRPLAGGCADLEPSLADCAFIPLNVEKDDFDPEIEDACGTQVEYAACLQEVSFGRGSVARSQPFVIDSAYAEFIKGINEAVAVDRDPAGRIQLLFPVEEGTTEGWKTIDAPLENLGLYREIMMNGCLGTVTDEVVGEGGVVTEVVYALDESAIDLLCGAAYDGVCAGGGAYASLLCEYPEYPEGEWWMNPSIPDPAVVGNDDLLWATTFIAGATDKSDPLGLDEFLNIDTYLGINTYTWTKVKKDRVLVVTYFDFGDFTYDRDVVFDPLTSEWLLTWVGGDDFLARDVMLFDDPIDGVDLTSVGIPVCRGGAVQMDGDEPLICDSSLDDPYDPDLGCGAANWFAQAAEDARKTIWYVHNWAVPEVSY